jgi:F-type H+-transporting ATPase subunit delta
MKHSEIAARYANAMFMLAKENNKLDVVFQEIREIKKIFETYKEIKEFVSSPLFKPSEKLNVFSKGMHGRGLTEVTEAFILLLAKKNRLSLFPEIVEAFQAKSDEENGVSRGKVSSAGVLSPEERTELEKIVNKVTGKKVILNYDENANLIGGLIAKVGSYTFDDTITGHLTRLQDDIKRSAH